MPMFLHSQRGQRHQTAVAETISTVGSMRVTELDAGLMLRGLPGELR